MLKLNLKSFSLRKLARSDLKLVFEGRNSDFYLSPFPHPKGFGSAMGILALDLIFKECKPDTLIAHVVTKNERSLNYNQRYGFVVDGKFQKLTQKGEQIDATLLVLTAEDWRSKRLLLCSQTFDIENNPVD